jgi:hypothetical protein
MWSKGTWPSYQHMTQSSQLLQAVCTCINGTHTACRQLSCAPEKTVRAIPTTADAFF